MVFKNTINECNSNIKELKDKIVPLEHLKDINIPLEQFYNLEYMRFRYGKILNEYYDRVKDDIDNINAIVLDIEQDEKYTWIIYFTSKGYLQKIDSYFNVMKFERVWLDENVQGKPKDVLHRIESYIRNNQNKKQEAENKLKEFKEKNEEELKELYKQIEAYLKIDLVKKYMAHDSKNSFYLIGWMPKDEVESLIPKLKNEDIECMVKSYDEVASTPPTKLRNLKIFKPFEKVVKMYGVPNYSELDPTSFVALTAFFMFGFMFGDVGQGIVILLLGLLLKFKKNKLGPIFVAGGISSVIFGFLYGSIFGKENIIPAILISPMKNITTMLLSGIIVGVVFILLAMMLNIKNGIKNKDKARVLLDKNGIAGLTFYGLVLAAIGFYFVKGKMILPMNVLIMLLLIPLLIILFKETIVRIVNKKKNGEKPSFIENVFELIETLLSFASNTIAFVRLAAFAINHVGLCMAIYILSNMANSAGQIAIAVIGNIIVIGLEGLIVSIQILRLEYYELFSRFYTGDGREYKPINEEVKKI